MSRHARHHVLKPFVSAILALAFLPWIAPAPPASAQSPTPTINVDPITDWLWANDFGAGSTISVTVNDAPAAGSPFVADGSGHISTSFGLDLGPGDIVVVDDETTAKHHAVAHVAVGSADPTTNVVTGSADPGSDVWVDVQGVNAGRTVYAGGAGTWTTDFDVPGDSGGTVDLRPGVWGLAQQCDADGDCTTLDWNVPNPTFHVQPEVNNVWGSEFTPDSSVTVTVNGAEVPGSPFPTDQDGTVSTPDFDPAVLDFDVADVVVLTDGPTTKEHTVTNLVIAGADPDTNVVAGTADPGSEVWVDVQGANAGRTVYADVGGNWTTDFDNVGDHGESFDIGVGTWGSAQECDADGDCTRLDWYVPDPRFSVDPSVDNMWGNDFLPESTVAVTVNAIEVPGSPFPTDGRGDISAGFDVVQLDLAEGDVIEMSDGSATKSHTITELVVTGHDPDTNVVSGMAAPGSDVYLDIHGAPDVGRTVTAAVSGAWSSDLDDAGDGGGTFDLVAGDGGYAHQCDVDNDCTWIDWRIPSPSFEVDPSREAIWANDYEPMASVAVTVNDVPVPGSPFPTDQWGNANADLFNQLDVVADDLVEVSDGTTTKDHTVTGLTVTEVDEVANVVSGEAAPGSDVWVDVHGQPDVGRTVTADGTGYWSTDFDDPGDQGGTYDFAEGEGGYTKQCDVDGDCTHVDWNVTTPRIVASVTHDEIWAENWPSDPDGRTLYFELDDPATPGIDVSGDMPLLITPWGTEAGDRSFGTYDVAAGMTLTVRNRPFADPLGAGLERNLAVSHIVVTDVDAEADTISGNADSAEGGYLCVWSHDAQLCSDEQGFSWDTGAAGTGDFVADFGSVGSDVAPGHWNEASQYDGDGDRTHFWWNLPPWVVVDLAPEDEAGDPLWPDEVRAESWLGPVVTLTVNGSFVADITVSGSEHDHETIELPGIDLEPGDVVTLSDGTDTKSVTVEALGIDEVNFSTDDPPNTIDGNANPYRDVRVEVNASVGGRWAERWVNADEAGDFLADFGIPGNGWREQWTAELGGPQGLGRNVRLEVYDADNDRVETRHCEGLPRIEVSRFDNQVTVFDFPQGTTVTIEIDDPNTPESPDYTATEVSTPNPDNPCETIIVFEIVDYVIPEQVTVVASDGTPEGTVTHDTIAFTIDLVDPDSDQISGTAPAGVEVLVEADGIWRYPIADDPDGAWLADFSVIPPDPDPSQQQTVDLGPGSSGRAIVVDEFGNATELTWRIAASNFSVDPTTENLWANEFEPNSAVNVEVNGTEVPGSPFGTDWSGHANIGFDPNEVDLTAGDDVVVYDATTTKEHTITVLTITLVDPDTNVVEGTAEPGTEVRVDVHGGSGDSGRTVAVDEFGDWATDFDDPGDGGQPYDFGQGDQGSANQCDPDNDCTSVQWRVPNANFQVDPQSGSIWANEFAPDSSIAITIDGEDAGSYPTDGWGNFDGNNFGLNFDVSAGSDVSIADAATTKNHIVTSLAVTEVDVDLDRVHGTAAPGVQVQVWLHSGEGNVEVSADGFGAWTADFAGMADLGPGSAGSSQECDDDGDCTQAAWWVANANFQVDPQSGSIWANEFAPDGEVTITIDAVGFGPYVLDGNGNFDGNHFGLQFPVVAGSEVVVTDQVTVKDHTVTNLAVTEVDPLAETVSGTADAGSFVSVWVHDESNPQLDVEVQPDGTWTADFSGLADLEPGSNGNSQQCDDDKDCTQVGWQVRNSNFQVDPQSGSIWANEFAPDSSIAITIDGEDAGSYPTDGWGNFDGNNFGLTFDVSAGSDVSIADAATTKNHTVTPLIVTVVDESENVVAGMTDPYAEVWIDVHDQPDVGRTVSANETGYWDTDLDTPGDGGGTHDIMFGDQGGYAAQCDEDGDCTWVNWQVRNAMFSVETPYAVWSHGGDEGTDWMEGAIATVIVDDDEDPVNGTLFETTVPIEGWGFQVSTEPFAIEPGQFVSVSDGVTTKVLHVVDVQITAVDQEFDAVSGTALPDAWVDVDVGSEFGGAHRTVQADSVTGDWFADFANPTPDHPDTFDIAPDVALSAQVFDDDGDSSHRGAQIQNPAFTVGSADGQVVGDGWMSEVEVTIEIDDGNPTNGVLYTAFTGTGGDGHFELYLGGEFDVEVGMVVTVTDGSSTKTHTVTAVAVTGVDDDADTVSGTADPGATVEVVVNAPLFADVWEQLAFQFGPGRYDRNPDSMTEHLAVRQAVAHAVDRDALAAAIPGAGEATDSFIDVVVPGLASDAWSQYDHDPVAAAALIESLCIDLARDCLASPPVVVFTTTEENPDRVLMADLLQPMLAAAGIEMVIDLEPAGEFFGTTLGEGRFDLGEWAFASDPSFDGLREAMTPMDPLERWSASNYRWGTPDSAVSNAGTERFAELLGLMHETGDPAELEAYAAEAEQILADQLVLIPLYVRAEPVESEGQPMLTVEADGSGNWTADFSGYFDLRPGHEGAAFEYDDDGDSTYTNWHVPNPTFGVHPPEHIVSDGESTDWTVGATMTVTVDDDDPATGPLFEAPTTVEPWGFYVETGGFVIERGHVVTATDGETTKVHEVVDVAIVGIDEVADTVFGTAPPGAEVDVAVEDGATGEWLAGRSVEADGSGDWVADFSVPGVEGHEQETADLGLETIAHAHVFDDDGDFTGARFEGNEPPDVTDVAGPLDPVPIGIELAVVATFADPDVADVHVADFDWGDGSSSPGEVEFSGGGGTAVGHHAYSTPGVYPVRVTVTDAADLSDEGVFEFVVVYDPDGGFVTGGGWIRAAGASSDDGDTYPGIDSDDSVNLGFNVKYKKNNIIPTGQVNVQLGDLHLHSERLDWLVVAPNGTATFHGLATIDGGTELHPFAVRVTDGGITGDEDRFEIRVVAPDRSPFSDDPLYQATGDLLGGSIKLHTR